MTFLYLIILGILDVAGHKHWGSLHPWTIWFVILVVLAFLDLTRAGTRRFR